MGLRAKITDAVYDHPRADDQINAVMGVIEAEQKHARADALFWAARQLWDTPITCTALTGPYWYGQGWKEAADHLMDLAGWDPSDGEAERTQLAARVRDLEAENQRLRALVGDLADDGTCWYDHHGYCQEHGWFATDPSCPHARARDIVID